jgi:hypothetical protein
MMPSSSTSKFYVPIVIDQFSLHRSSGHGGQVKDVSGDEDDGNDECIYPVDFKQAGQIIDDQSESR